MPTETARLTVMPWNGGVNTRLEESLIDFGELTVGDNLDMSVDDSRKKRQGVDMNFDDGKFELTKIVTIADVSDSLDGTFFQLNDAAGSVGVWIDVDDSGTTIPAGASALDRAIEVTGVVTNDSATAVASAIVTALDADSEFHAYHSGSTITVIHKASGELTNSSDGDTGFTFSSPNESIIGLKDFHYGTTNSKTQRLISISDQGGFYNIQSDGTKTLIELGGTAWSGVPESVSTLVFNNKLLIANDIVGDEVYKYDPLNSSTMDNLGGSPPEGSILQTHNGRVWMNDKDNPDRIHYSETSNAEVWNGSGDSGAFDIRPFDGDKTGITAIFPSFNGILFVAKRRKLYRIDGFHPELMEIKLVSDGVGCISHESVVSTDNDIYWVSERGIHSLRATNQFGDVEKAFISRKIQKTFNQEFSFSRLKFVKGQYLRDKNLVVWTFTEESVDSEANFTQSSNSVNNQIWSYNVETGIWFKHFKDIPCESVAVAQDSDQDRIYIGADNQRVIKTETGSDNDTNFSGTEVPIPYIVSSGRIFPDNDFFSQKAFKSISPIFKSPAVFTLTVKIDNGLEQSILYSDFGKGDLLGTTFVTGVSVLSGESILAPFARSISGRGRSIKISIVQNELSEPVEIQGFIIEFENADVSKEVRRT